MYPFGPKGDPDDGGHYMRSLERRCARAEDIESGGGGRLDGPIRGDLPIYPMSICSISVVSMDGADVRVQNGFVARDYEGGWLCDVDDIKQG